MIESPNMVTMSEPPRSGRCRRKRATSSAAAVEALAVIFRHCNRIKSYDTENIDLCVFVYHNTDAGQLLGAGMYTQALGIQGSDATTPEVGAPVQLLLRRDAAQGKKETKGYMSTHAAYALF